MTSCSAPKRQQIRPVLDFLNGCWCSRYNLLRSPLSKSMAEQAYKPSQAVPISGVYRVEHNGHREAHEATLLQGESFPACNICGGEVRFTLKHRAPDIRGD